MSSRVSITSYIAIILILFYSYCNIQIATLKIRTKYNLTFSIQLYFFASDDLFYIFANVVNCLLDNTHFYIVFFTVFPLISITFMQLYRVYVSWSTIDYLKNVVAFYLFNYTIDYRVLIGQWDGAGWKFRHPTIYHIWLKGILLLEYISSLILFVEADKLQLLFTLIKLLIPPVYSMIIK